jgi:hypothetical protein
MDEIEVIEEEKHEPTEQVPAETPGETIEDLEDRLINALKRNEQLEGRITELEGRITELERSKTSGAIPQSNHSDTSNGTSNGTTERKPDTPPKPPHFWFRKFGE